MITLICLSCLAVLAVVGYFVIAATSITFSIVLGVLWASLWIVLLIIITTIYTQFSPEAEARKYSGRTAVRSQKDKEKRFFRDIISFQPIV